MQEVGVEKDYVQKVDGKNEHQHEKFQTFEGFLLLPGMKDSTISRFFCNKTVKNIKSAYSLKYYYCYRNGMHKPKESFERFLNTLQEGLFALDDHFSTFVENYCLGKIEMPLPI